MDPPLLRSHKLIASSINSFVEIFGEKNVRLLITLIFLKKMNSFENAPKKALTLQLQGGSVPDMDQYTLEQLLKLGKLKLKAC